MFSRLGERVRDHNRIAFCVKAFFSYLPEMLRARRNQESLQIAARIKFVP
jgi:hypothetical protein